MIKYLDNTIRKERFPSGSMLITYCKRKNGYIISLVFLIFYIIICIPLLKQGMMNLKLYQEKGDTEMFNFGRNLLISMTAIGILLIAIFIITFTKRRKLLKDVYLKYAKKFNYTPEQIKEFDNQVMEEGTFFFYDEHGGANEKKYHGIVTKDYIMIPKFGIKIIHKKDICAAFYTDYYGASDSFLVIIQENGSEYAYPIRKKEIDFIVSKIAEQNPAIFTENQVKLPDGTNARLPKEKKKVIPEYLKRKALQTNNI